MKRLALALLLAFALNATPVAAEASRWDAQVAETRGVPARDTGKEKQGGTGGTAVVMGDGGGY